MNIINDADMHRAIGRLEGRFDSFDIALKTVSDQIVAHDLKTTNGQAGLRLLIEDKADGLADDINQLGVRVDNLESHETFAAGAAGVKSKLYSVVLKIAPYLAGAGLTALGAIATQMGAK